MARSFLWSDAITVPELLDMEIPNPGLSVDCHAAGVLYQIHAEVHQATTWRLQYRQWLHHQFLFGKCHRYLTSV